MPYNLKTAYESIKRRAFMHVWQAFANPLTLLASLEGSYAPSIEHTRRLKLPIEAAVCRVEEPQ